MAPGAGGPGLNPLLWLSLDPSVSVPKTSEIGGRRLFVWVAGVWWICDDVDDKSSDGWLR